jgi:hypothetical protein
VVVYDQDLHGGGLGSFMVAKQLMGSGLFCGANSTIMEFFPRF